ncbi:MAG: alpha/beta hydrolase, partial [Corynebacterium sp.]|nr:alpha/beta hydrolase [Corynebacterium sp.]
MSANLKKHLATLSKRGRNRVLVGDLDYAGITGKVYTPAEGQSLPAVAFGHDWMHKIKDYHATLRHLASWGIVVVAPDSETGPFPDHRNLAADMESALQIAAGVKLGSGNITVSPGKLGMIGHGMGGGTAV